VKLKPCPFCGGEAVTCLLFHRFRCACRNPACGATGPMRKTEVAAIRAWNRRAKSEGESDE
jgi:Lar family restriction alleviation protein